MDGLSVGLLVGDSVAWLGLVDGLSVGLFVGDSVAWLGLVDGLSVGPLVGDSVAWLGLVDGLSVGLLVGDSVAWLGLVDGLSVGPLVGDSVASVGLALGTSPSVAFPKASSVILNAEKLSSSSSSLTRGAPAPNANGSLSPKGSPISSSSVSMTCLLTNRQGFCDECPLLLLSLLPCFNSAAAKPSTTEIWNSSNACVITNNLLKLGDSDKTLRGGFRRTLLASVPL